jgi:hypothetical protein
VVGGYIRSELDSESLSQALFEEARCFFSSTLSGNARAFAGSKIVRAERVKCANRGELREVRLERKALQRALRAVLNESGLFRCGHYAPEDDQTPQSGQSGNTTDDPDLVLPLASESSLDRHHLYQFSSDMSLHCLSTFIIAGACDHYTPIDAIMCCSNKQHS